VARNGTLSQFTSSRICNRSRFQSQPIRTYASRPQGFQGVVARYEDLPDDYEDEGGLEFRSTPLSQTEAKRIFGPGIDVGLANRVLRIIHGRRVAGTLADPSLAAPAVGFDNMIKTSALAWLRKNVPVDEQDSAGQRAELELQAMEAEILADGERLGLYKPNSGDVSKKEKRGQNSLYGSSGLDAIRQAREKEFEEKEQAAEAARQKQADEIRHTTGPLSTESVRSRVELRRPGENPRLQYYLDRAKVLPDVPPEMSAWQRLWPSALVVLCVVGASVGFTSVYVPLSHSARMWPDMPPAAATVITLIAANTLVFVAWRVPPAFRILNKYFLSVPGYPRALAIVGNIFSHQTASHFAINMIVLWLVGTPLHDAIGRGNFLALYLSSGVISSFVSLTAFTLRKNFVTSSLGASGAISGLIGAYLWIHFNDHFKLIFDIFPPETLKGIPGYFLLGCVVSMDVYGLFRGWKVGTKFDHVAHLGGYATGIAAAEMIRRKAQEKRRLESERRKNLSIGDRIKSWR
jgi:rhomboid-like protein